MSETFRNPKELQVSYCGRFEVKTGPLAEVRGIGPEVYRHVPDVAGEDAHEFTLGFAKLVMEASKDASVRERLIVLCKLTGKTGCGKR